MTAQQTLVEWGVYFDPKCTKIERPKSKWLIAAHVGPDECLCLLVNTVKAGFEFLTKNQKDCAFVLLGSHYAFLTAPKSYVECGLALPYDPQHLATLRPDGKMHDDDILSIKSGVAICRKMKRNHKALILGHPIP